MALLLPRYKYKKGVLLILNLLFCFAGGGLLSFLVIAFFGMITFWGGIIIGKYSSRGVFVFILMVSLSPLLFFKYAGFIFNTFLGAQISALSTLTTPIGISFYTFQGVGYLIDVYKRRMKPTDSFIHGDASKLWDIDLVVCGHTHIRCIHIDCRHQFLQHIRVKRIQT